MNDKILRKLIIGFYVLSFWILLPLLLFKLSEKLDKYGSNRSFPTIFRVAGVLISIFSSLLLFIAIKDFRRGTGKLPITAIPPYNKLASKGLYSIWRHPVYLFYVLLITGVALMTGSAGFFYIVLPVFSIVVYIHSRIEEMWLIKKHGKPYIKYLKQTSLIFPQNRSAQKWIFENCKRYLPQN